MKSKLENGEVIEEYRAKFKHSQFVAHGAIEAFITNALNQQRESGHIGHELYCYDCGKSERSELPTPNEGEKRT